MKKKSITPAPKKNVNGPARSDIFMHVDAFLKKKSVIVFFALLCIEVLISYLLFDLKMNPGGDDSTYVLNGFNFVHDFTYPGYFEGALYPMFLSIFIKMAGVNILLLKCLSFICMLGFFALFYISYRNKVPHLLLFSVILLISFNSHLLYFSSQTLTEAFFLMVQACLFFTVNEFFINKENHSTRSYLLSVTLLGFVLFILTITRNIGLGCFAAVIAYFLLTRSWKDALFVTASFGIFSFLFEVLKRLVWPSSDFQISSQGKGLLYKDFYNPSKGYEDFSGFISRLVDNSNVYISLDFYNILGLRNQMSLIPTLTVITYALFLVMAYVLFKNNKYLLFAGIYSGVMAFITFISIQAMWDQERLIVVYVPYLLLFFLGGGYYLLKKSRQPAVQSLFFVGVCVLLLTAFKSTSQVVKIKRKEFVVNAGNDPYKGFNDGITNFIKMSKWAHENLDQDKVILSRKPDIGFVYTGRKFLGVYSVPNISSDSLFSLMSGDTENVYYSVNHKDFYLEDDKYMYSIYNDYRKYYTGLLYFAGSNRTEAKESVEFQIFRLPKDKAKGFMDTTSSLKIPVMTDVKGLIETYRSQKYALTIYQPDVLFNWLRQNQVSHVIMANISLSNKLKPEKHEYITTIQHYLRPVWLKYPIFSDVHVIGNNSETNATLIALDYGKLPK